MNDSLLEMHLRRIRSALQSGEQVARKKLGQHFLLDASHLRRIVAAAGDVRDRVVVEVGPGPGSLTAALLEAGARIVAFELDPSWAEFSTRWLGSAGELQIIPQDVCSNDSRDLRDLLKQRRDVNGRSPLVVSNLPFQIASTLLVDLVHAEVPPERIVVTIQQEVAARVLAEAGNRERGLLTVLIERAAAAQSVFRLSPGCFTPPPRVASRVVAIVPDLRRREESLALRTLDPMLRAAFNGRRKMLRKSLRSIFPRELLEELPTELLELRPEDLPLTSWLTLARALERIAPRVAPG